VKELAYKHRDIVLSKRAASAVPPDKQNQFKPGDFILFDRHVAPEKLAFRYEGPYEVIGQNKNDVECRHLALRFIKKFHVDRCGLFAGSRDEAFAMACLDRDQFAIAKITGYRGDPIQRKQDGVMGRSGMEFRVLFADNDVRWLPYGKDLTDTIHFEEFCEARPELRVLLRSSKEATEYVSRLNRTALAQLVAPGTTVYVDLRFWGSLYYDELTLPDLYDKVYVFECVYSEWQSRGKLIALHCYIRDESCVFNGYKVCAWGSNLKFPPGAVLVDAAMAIRHPEVLPEKTRAAILRRLSSARK
jgi:hypothetical protein